MPNETKNKIEILECHGVNFTKRPATGTAQGDCPFCNKENHFFCHVTTGKWQCKVCHKDGNAYTFMQEHYNTCLKNTKRADYETLSSQRDKLPAVAFRNAKYAYDRGFHRWLLPLFNRDKVLSNLLHWDGYADNPKAYSTPTCKQHLGRFEKIRSVGPIYIVEGPWDAVALGYFFEKAGRDLTTVSIVYVAGSGMSLENYIEDFKGRDLLFVYDNDDAGVDGQTKEAQRLSKIAKSIKKISWPSTFPAKYDVRVFVTERIDSLKKALKEFDSFFEAAADVKPLNLPKVPTFQALVKQFRKILHLEQNQLNALAVCLATVASVGTRGTPLWFFLVGTPGSGKSEMLLAFSRLHDYCLFLSRLTSEALISGFSGTDCSVMAYLANRCLVIKDFTSVKAMSQEKQIDLLGLLRDAYDGEVAKPFGNAVGVRSYSDCWFPMLAGVTHVIHADNQSSYGERFLKFELLDDDHDVMKQTRASMAKSANDAVSVAPDDTLKNAIIAFFSQRKLDRTKMVKIMGTKYEAKIEALAQIDAIIRTSADRKGNVYAYRPQPENPGRLGSQFTKLAQHLCWVFDKTTMDDDVYQIVKKAATDTVVSWSLEIVQALLKHPNGICITKLTGELQVAVETIRPHLETLCQIVYPYGRKDHGPIIHIEDEPQTTGSVRMRRSYRLDPRFVQFWRTADLPFTGKATRRKATRGPKRGSQYKKEKSAV